MLLAGWAFVYSANHQKHWIEGAVQELNFNLPTRKTSPGILVNNWLAGLIILERGSEYQTGPPSRTWIYSMGNWSVEVKLKCAIHSPPWNYIGHCTNRCKQCELIMLVCCWIIINPHIRIVQQRWNRRELIGDCHFHAIGFINRPPAFSSHGRTVQWATAAVTGALPMIKASDTTDSANVQLSEMSATANHHSIK